MRKTFSILVVTSIMALSACGDTLLEQGLLGAGAGAAGAAVVGGDTTTGALAGASVNIFCQSFSTRC